MITEHRTPQGFKLGVVILAKLAEDRVVRALNPWSSIFGKNCWAPFVGGAMLGEVLEAQIAFRWCVRC